MSYFALGFVAGGLVATVIYVLAYFQIRRDHRWALSWRDRLLADYRRAVWGRGRK